MKHSITLLICLLLINILTAQNVGIGTISPIARLSVDSSIMVDQSNQNDGISLKSALVFGSDGLSGIARSYQAGSAARSGLSFYTKGIRRITLDVPANWELEPLINYRHCMLMAVRTCQGTWV